jgi:hypothetical protein
MSEKARITATDATATLRKVRIRRSEKVDSVIDRNTGCGIQDTG